MNHSREASGSVIRVPRHPLSSRDGTQARLSSGDGYVALVTFRLLATSSFVALELHSVIEPGVAGSRLGSLRGWLDKHGDLVIVVLCLPPGLWLAGQSNYLLVA